MANKRKRRNNPQDVLTVFAVLAIIALACVFGTWIGHNPQILTGGAGVNRRSEEYEQAQQYSRMLIICIGVVSAAVIGLFIRSMVKRKRKERLEQQKKYDELRELEEARRRVEEARRNQFIKAGMSEISRRRSESDNDDIYDGGRRYTDRESYDGRESHDGREGYYDREKYDGGRYSGRRIYREPGAKLTSVRRKRGISGIVRKIKYYIKRFIRRMTKGRKQD